MPASVPPCFDGSVSKHYGAIAFTDAVREVQHRYGSDGFYDRKRVQGTAAPGADPLTDDEKDYLAELMTAEQSPTSSEGNGFLSVLDIERRSHELLVQSFHLFDETQMVIKTQSILEVIKNT